MVTYEELQKGLQSFYGTTAYHHLNPFIDTVATDGVKYLCKEAECFWLFDEIAFFAKKRENLIPFICVKVLSKNNKATIDFEDGDCWLIEKKEVPFTDLPEGEYKFFVTDNVIMLPSEY